MTAYRVNTHPIEGQSPGTSGLRKKTQVFMGPHYLENYVQAIFDAIGGAAGKSFVLGGDGRYFNDRAVQVILRMAAANGAAKLVVGANGIMSTPAASHLIRIRGADGGLILSASHNPGGPDGDFGLKFNMANGGPATEALTDKILSASQTLDSYTIIDSHEIDLSTPRVTSLAGMVIEVIDPVSDYAALMEELFDFEAIRSLFEGGFTMRFDAMNAVTGPYAKAILEDKLGAETGSVVNAVPLPDFGGLHPDPNPVWADALMSLMTSDKSPDFGAASDGDGDRNMITGRGIYITPSDSLAVLVANAHLVPAYTNGCAGVARSMPTSAAADRVAAELGIPVFETPTGWKYFGTLLDAGKVTLCGEESAGTGSTHVREKDGLWAVLFWLNILARTGKSVADLMQDHWARFGRNYYQRHDYENLDSERARAVVEQLRSLLPSLPGQNISSLVVKEADEFSYQDPIDGTYSKGQGIRIQFDGGARAVFRLSGTGTEGATLRVYLEQVVDDPSQLNLPTSDVLKPVAEAVTLVSHLSELTGRKEPDVIT